MSLSLKFFQWKLRHPDQELVADAANQIGEILSRCLDGRRATQNTVVPKGQLSTLVLMHLDCRIGEQHRGSEETPRDKW